MTRGRKKAPKPATPAPDTVKPAGAPSERPDAVEEASKESFPASDAPSWVPLHTGKPGKHPDQERR